MILAIDIGGTKFSMAVFDGDRMVRRESHATDAGAAAHGWWSRSRAIAGGWRREFPLERCGIGFGGPGEFRYATRSAFHPCRRLADFDLCGFVRDVSGAPPVWITTPMWAPSEKREFGAGQGCSPLFYMTLSTGIGGGIWEDGRVWRGADSYGGEIGHLTHAARWARVSVRRAWLPGAALLRALAATRSRPERAGADARRRVC